MYYVLFPNIPQKEVRENSLSNLIDKVLNSFDFSKIGAKKTESGYKFLIPLYDYHNKDVWTSLVEILIKSSSLIYFKEYRDKIVKDKKYELWVKVESTKSGRGGKFHTFKFDLENLPELISQ